MRLGLLFALLSASLLWACASSGRRDTAVSQFSPLPIATGDYPSLGHAADFSWIAGRVERDLSCVYLRFGSPAKSPWGGRLVIVAPAGEASLLESGDSVVLRGSIANMGFGGCGAPAYLVSTVEEH